MSNNKDEAESGTGDPVPVDEPEGGDGDGEGGNTEVEEGIGPDGEDSEEGATADPSVEATEDGTTDGQKYENIGKAAAVASDFRDVVEELSRTVVFQRAVALYAAIGGMMGLMAIVGAGQLQVVSGLGPRTMIGIAIYMSPVIAVIATIRLESQFQGSSRERYVVTLFSNAVGFFALVLVTAVFGSLAGNGFAVLRLLGDLILVLFVLWIPVGFSGVGTVALKDWEGVR